MADTPAGDMFCPDANIAPDGDVVLLVGPEEFRLRVHSHFLRSASKVFNAMLGPHWSEGQGLSQENPYELRLAEDDAYALQTICSIIHHRNDNVPQDLTAMQVLQIAIEIDKFDLNVALRFATKEWLKSSDKMPVIDKGFLMAAASLLKCNESLMANSLELILEFRGSYWQLMEHELIRLIMPLKAFHLLEERRTCLRGELDRILSEGIRSSCSCGWGDKLRKIFEETRSNEEPDKFFDQYLSIIIEEMDDAYSNDMPRRARCKKNREVTHEPLPGYEEFQEELENLEKMACICLDCLQGHLQDPCPSPIHLETI